MINPIIKRLKEMAAVYIQPKFSGNLQEIKPDKETILIVTHEASLSGAPVLSLRIAEALSQRYQIVILTLGMGPLIENFRALGAVVVIAPSARQPGQRADRIITKLLKKQSFKYALVNSIESRAALPVLARFNIPTVSLFHEFAAYIRPTSAFQEAIALSSQCIFSTQLTHNNACALNPDLKAKSFPILPQGRCVPPQQLHGNKEAERLRIQQAFRPKLDENNLVILGAGYVQMRKGVDLFIECAARLKQEKPDLHVRFVWIGEGYDPEKDYHYSLYLADQIQRANLEDIVAIIPATSEILYAYQQADLFLLSARLDPLPNVAIDAFYEGLPVICFEKTTGITDFLMEEGVAQDCIAEYLNPADMATKAGRLLEDNNLHHTLATKLKQAATQKFNMEHYSQSLDSIASKILSVRL